MEMTNKMSKGERCYFVAASKAWSGSGPPGLRRMTWPSKTHASRLGGSRSLSRIHHRPTDYDTNLMKHWQFCFPLTVITAPVWAELDGNESEALDLVPLVTNVVIEVSWRKCLRLMTICFLQEHQLVVGIVVIADPGTVPINSRWDKIQAIRVDLMKKYIWYFQGRKTKNASSWWIFSRSARPNLCCI